ncbi:MAG: ATP synthase F1 subunit epsilon [bacterium]|nr:ATP synthase F1 subunit epsilon [bacterium]
MLRLKIITPKKIVFDQDVDAVSVPSADGVLTILKHHANLFSLLVDGILKIRIKDQEQFLSIGGGYLETNGEETFVLVSKAHGQDEIDKSVTEKAVADVKQILTKSMDEKERQEASALLRRSLIDLKLLTKKKAPKSFNE